MHRKSDFVCRQLSSLFFGGVNASDCGTIWTVAKKVSYLERVSFVLHYYNTEQQVKNYTRFMDTCPGVILYADASIVAIIGNHWRILYGKYGSNISISSSTFASNEAYHGGMLNVTDGSTINLYTCTFDKCKRDVLINAIDAVVIIAHNLFFNTSMSRDTMIYGRDNALTTMQLQLL